MRKRSDAELLEEIGKFEHAIADEFEGRLKLLDFVPIFDEMCKKRAEKLLENRLGHLNNADFILLTKMVSEATNLFTRKTPPAQTPLSATSAGEAQVIKEQVALALEPKLRGRPKKS